MCHGSWSESQWKHFACDLHRHATVQHAHQPINIITVTQSNQPTSSFGINGGKRRDEPFFAPSCHALSNSQPVGKPHFICRLGNIISSLTVRDLHNGVHARSTMTDIARSTYVLWTTARAGQLSHPLQVFFHLSNPARSRLLNAHAWPLHHICTCPGVAGVDEDKRSPKGLY